MFACRTRSGDIVEGRWVWPGGDLLVLVFQFLRADFNLKSLRHTQRALICRVMPEALLAELPFLATH